MASATVAWQSGSGLRVGSVISRAFPICGRLVVPFCLLYAIQVLPAIIQSTAVQPHQVRGHAVTALSLFPWPLIVASLLGALIALVTHAATYVATIRIMEGEKLSILTALQTAMGRFLPLLGTWMSGGLLIAFGFILLFVPGLMIYTKLFVMGPVCVIERLGPNKSLRRSGELTKGSRWRIFGIVLLLGVLGALTSLSAAPARAALGPLAGALVRLVLMVLINLFGTIVLTIVYRDLADSHDGYGGNRLASVFD